jgi:hypothetical protein
MSPEETIRRTMKAVKEDRRRYRILRHRMNPKKMRWERRQMCVMKVLRRTMNDWRKRGIAVARGDATESPKPIEGKPIPIPSLCYAAYEIGFRDERRRLELVARRKHDWARVGSLQEHLLGTAECRIDRQR